METTSDSQIAVTCEQQPESSSERAPMEVLDVEQGQPNAEEEEEEGEVPVGKLVGHSFVLDLSLVNKLNYVGFRGGFENNRSVVAVTRAS